MCTFPKPPLFQNGHQTMSFIFLCFFRVFFFRSPKPLESHGFGPPVKRCAEAQGHLRPALAVLLTDLFASRGGADAQGATAQGTPGLHQNATWAEIHRRCLDMHLYLSMFHSCISWHPKLFRTIIGVHIFCILLSYIMLHNFRHTTRLPGSFQ